MNLAPNEAATPGAEAAFNRLDSLARQSAPGDSVARPNRQQQVIDSLRASSDLGGTVTYSATDSIVFDVNSGQMLLYSSGKIQYDELELKADRVRIDMNDQVMWAGPVTDSSGKVLGELPQFKQGEDNYSAKELTYNFQTEQGRVIEGRMIEGDAFILADVAKYHEDGSFHGADGKYTTCDADHPHFYIQSRKLKVLPDQQMISGPLNLVIADFPIPIVVPFGFLPNIETKGRKRGIVMPTYGNQGDRGFFLRNLGYYLPISDNFDLKIDGDIYTRGGWRLGARTRYNIKYGFQGNLGIEYGVQTFNERTDPDFRRNAAWRVTWSHNQPINPTARISASVNISSSSSFQRAISFQQNDFFQNNLNSSVSFSKSFNNLPFSLNMSARHQQDLNKGTMSLQLPEMSFNVNRQTPFRGVSGDNLNWLRQVGVTYNFQARNSIRNIADSLLWQVLANPSDTVLYPEVTGGDTIFVNRLGRDFFQNGAQHRANASTNFKLFQYINIAPNINYTEYWYTRSIDRRYNPETGKVEETDIPGFARAYDFNGGVSANTNFFGVYDFAWTERELKMRQRFSPSVGYSLRPDFADEQYGFYQEVQVDTLGRTRQFSRFSNGIYGGPGSGEQQAITFSLNSVVEMKYRKKESFDPDFDPDEEAFEYTNLLDNISIGSSYNLAADSFQLSTFRLAARTSLFNNKLSVNASSTLDPYFYGTKDVASPLFPGVARRQPEFMYTRTGQLARLTQAQVSLRTSFRSERRGGRAAPDPDRTAEFDQVLYNEVNMFPQQYVDFDVPWSVDLNYNFSYNKRDLNPANVTQTLNVSGSLGFTPNWQIRLNSGYDLSRMEFTNTSLNVYRLLHCWEMSFQWVPFGPLKSYSVTINVRNATLQQLRVSKNNFWQNRFD